MSTIDPVGPRYFRPLQIADTVSDVLFYISAVLSLIAPLVHQATSPHLYDAIQIIFALSVLAYFVCGLVIRLYFSPRAQEKRYEDFLSHALDQPLNFEQTSGYYNNSQATNDGRISAQVLESSFFSKNILQKMVMRERLRVAVYAILWLVAILNRSTDLALIAVMAQIVFSEQILSRWIRLEWLRIQCEQIYAGVFRAFQSKAALQVIALEYLGRYEMAKATAGISLSSGIFEKNREIWNGEWDKIRGTLKL